MKPKLRPFFAMTLALVLPALPAQAQSYPTRPIQVIVPFAGGSGSDVIARIVLERMGDSLGQRFVVDNRPAAGGNVGTQAGAKAPADGYNLLFSTIGPLAINKALYPNLGYDPEKDFEPISLVAILPNIMVVSSSMPVKTVSEFIDFAKKSPTAINYSSPGNGTSTHISAAYFAHVAGLKMTHVPYRVTPQLISDLMTGEVPVSFLLLSSVNSAIQSGKARALAITSSKRLEALPEVPTMAEAGVPNYESAAWFALVAPKGTPKPIVDKLNQEVRAALADPAVLARFKDLGTIAAPGTPEELAKFISAETAKWQDVITRTGVTVQQ
jgi:tripartite-type tricarboxylate transporter receptor subunit TctC